MNNLFQMLGKFNLGVKINNEHHSMLSLQLYVVCNISSKFYSYACLQLGCTRSDFVCKVCM